MICSVCYHLVESALGFFLWTDLLYYYMLWCGIVGCTAKMYRWCGFCAMLRNSVCCKLPHCTMKSRVGKSSVCIRDYVVNVSRVVSVAVLLIVLHGCRVLGSLQYPVC